MTLTNEEKEIIETIAEALPHMSDFDKGHMLGTAENIVRQKRARQQEPEQEAG
ncbi:MAG: hypothetical protein J6I64_06840 [Lachnospiraceae bacterium]|nr:hypothetical protein [Lachnospiraceae bacterium]